MGVADVPPPHTSRYDTEEGACVPWFERKSAGELCITADTALRLARYFGNSPEFWLGLQMTHDLCKALAKAEEIERIVPAAREKAA